MVIQCLGLSHRTAPIELRERLGYPSSALNPALARFGCSHAAQPAGINELVILSTCNRLELYAVASSEQFDALINFIGETRGVSRTEFEPHVCRLVGAEAVMHLGRVAAGLDSMILGEPQILGQITQAYEAALGHSAAGPILSALFRSAIHVGKRARTETAISRNPATVSSIAARLAESAVDDLCTAQALIVGAGEMAELAVKALRARGAKEIAVVNRTYERALRLAERWGGRALTFEQLSTALATADIVLTSTDAPHFLITPEMTRAAIERRPARPLVMIDIAMPRNIDPSVKDIPNVHCYDIDDLQAHLNGAVAEREIEIPRVEAIISEEVSAFMTWLQSLEVKPVIAELHAKADALRRVEVDKALRHLPNLSDEERQWVELLAESLVNKLLHAPTLRLKAEANNGHAAEYAAALRYLFALDA